MPAFGPLVSAAWLREHLEDPELLVVDFRWYLDGRDGGEAYRRGHIPGAVFVDLAEVTGEGPGRHPLPTREGFEAAARKAGIGSETVVVAYDDASGSNAGRLWWLLRWFGHGRQAVLDGGIQAWGEPLETGVNSRPPGDFVARDPDRGRVLTYQQVTARPPDLKLLDARAPERYRGEVEPIDPRAGHIPGALSAYWKENTGPDGRYLPPDRLRALYEAKGLRPDQPVGVYCGSGVSAVQDLIALELAGFQDVLLYAGSWSDWSNRPDAPVATGSNP